MQLEDFYDYKNKFMEHILTNEKIVSLLSEKDEDGNDIYTLENSRELMYKQVFPFLYVPETIHDGCTYVCCDVDVQEAPDKTFYEAVIYVWVFAHRSRLRLPNGEGVRTDKICSEIAKTINGSREYGLGELDFYMTKRFAPVSDYDGKQMFFYATEFNRQYNPNKYTPANRKGR